MVESKTNSSQEVEKTEVWTNEEFEAFIDTELKKDPLHKDYPELFKRGELCSSSHSFATNHSYAEMMTDKSITIFVLLQHPKSFHYGDNDTKEMHLCGSVSSSQIVS
jgi:hypothetical protein